IHIYRCGKDRSGSFIGTAEHVGTKGKLAFSSVDELWDIINQHTAAEGNKAAARTVLKEKPKRKS
ncbi:MAG: hypothetical protein M1491_03000, partial [Deltaproteobacteria bacterium]|nr:hypothetical protein [Deltaproteobacteria bacterium]